MNQDSERHNDRSGHDRRDGKGRDQRRRDDDHSVNEPRFSRSRNDQHESDQRGYDRRGDERSGDDRNRYERRSSDRSGYGQRSDARRSDARHGDARPRFEREGDGAANRPRFNRDERNSNEDNDRSYKSRFNDRNRSGNDRPDQPTDKPRFERGDNRSGSDRSGHDRRGNDRSDNYRTDKPRFERSNDRSGSNHSGYNRRSDDRPSRFAGNRDEWRSDPAPTRFNRDGFDKPRFNDRDNRRGNEHNGDDKPTFDRGRDRFGDYKRSDDRSGDNPRNDRAERRERNDSAQGNRPSRFSRDDKPGFKRVGGFNRDADERNRSEHGNQRNDERGYGSANERFSTEQRKQSGERRTGRFTKAPNYNTEQAPFKSAQRDSKSRFDRDDDQSRRRGNGRNDERRGDERSGNRYRNDARHGDARHGDVSQDQSGLTRLNRYIANSGVCSRREADELIARGDISVNGNVITEMGFKVKDGDTVKYGTKVLNPERFVYVLLNKPKDYITTTDDPEERKTVMELVADAGNFRIYPVGRLDRNTTGLLLLTNDGELADKLTHPSNNIRKIYQVEIDKPITEEHFDILKRGIELEDGPIKPDAISIITPDAQVIGIEIHSGRNRIVRRMFESLGYEVTKLDRTTFAGLTKKELPRGKWRFLDPKEVVKLKYLS